MDNQQRKTVNNDTSWQWHLSFVGQYMQHNYYLYHTIDRIMINNRNISGIVEIGTGHGALTAFLGMWGIKRDIPVLSVDHENMHNDRLFEHLEILYLQMDEFSDELVEKVTEFVHNLRGPTLFICDGGDKVREFNFWVPLLTPATIVAVHDWTLEVNQSDIDETINSCCVPYEPHRWNEMNVQFAVFKIKSPFMSIVTRNHPDRESQLNRCMSSLREITDKDFSQVVIHSDFREDIPRANRLFYEYRHRVVGDYVFILDDDDYLGNNSLVEDMKKIVEEQGSPDIIFIRMFLRGELYPPNDVWESKELIPGSLGSSCFVMENSLWQDSVDQFKTTESPGDYNFINAAFSKAKNVYWHDKAYANALQLNRGRPGI